LAIVLIIIGVLCVLFLIVIGALIVQKRSSSAKPSEKAVASSDNVYSSLSLSNQPQSTYSIGDLEL
jgi:flagellar basal body-associated protein FliL